MGARPSVEASTRSDGEESLYRASACVEASLVLKPRKSQPCLSTTTGSGLAPLERWRRCLARSPRPTMALLPATMVPSSSTVAAPFPIPSDSGRGALPYLDGLACVAVGDG
jgi:hypothetical protein